MFQNAFVRRLLRSSLARLCIGWLFASMSFALPVQRLRETDSLLAFYHPRPSYRVHILIVPKEAVASLAELDPADQAFLSDLIACVQSLVIEMGLDGKGYRLIVNGGEYQDLPQLHFHLVAGENMERSEQER